jgi:glycosyltransferase involved in cell wall biosynthesis
VVKASNRLIIPNQRAGIASAAAVHWFPKGVVPAGDALLDDLGVRDERRFFFMMADLDQIELMPLPDNERLRIFSATRLTWKRPFPAGFSDFDDKGSDVMIRGLGMFRRITQTRLDIRLVKKGMHVEESMALAAEEGVADQITWLEEMSQAEVREEYKRADIVVEQLRSSMMGMAGLDAMATGRPVIANVRPDTAKSWLKAVPPVCQATDAETVCAHLQRLTNRDERQRVGIAARRFAEHFFSPDAAAEQCLQRLSAASMSAAERQPAAAR